MDNKTIKFNVWFCRERLGICESVSDAQNIIYSHPKYKKSLFTKRGKTSSNNPNQNEYFSIYDSEGYGWNIR
ncbi:hypothetical protein [Paenibacillus tianjinensis]|uniref:Uncharacterized protein n=1 Tax=Paenibacillus tianjinensis TaxID=2810347 RepID=A0ABX7L842_9BACL|nr:hypothetical protein [Paenibacillus tianjinensis]QSF43511.1 hypothetical protein JRJ22_19810 [Paenibacillus tianjinensis]